MTQDEWLACTDPGPMMGLLQRNGEAGERGCCLFACACVRRVWALIPDAACGWAVEAAERFVDGAAGVDELAAALAALRSCRRRRGAAAAAHDACWYAAYHTGAASRVDPAYEGGPPYEWPRAGRAAFHAGRAAVQRAASEAQRSRRPAREVMRAAKDAEDQAQSDLLRDIFGPLPFRSLAVDPAWLAWSGGTVVRLAEAAYDYRIMPAGTLDPTRLAVLADALEEAGCEDAEILGHLRGPGPHVRGCHVVDLVTGKG